MAQVEVAQALEATCFWQYSKSILLHTPHVKKKTFFSLLKNPRLNMKTLITYIWKVNGTLFLDKREASQLDYLTVNETAVDPPTPGEDPDNNINAPERLSLEATMINQNFSQQILKPGNRKVREGVVCRCRNYFCMAMVTANKALVAAVLVWLKVAVPLPPSSLLYNCGQHLAVSSFPLCFVFMKSYHRISTFAVMSIVHYIPMEKNGTAVPL